MRFIISPYSSAVAKDYPYWSTLIGMLRSPVNHITQVGVGKEVRLDVDEHCFNLRLADLQKKECDIWLAVDNFFPHMVNCCGFRGQGIVLWGKSDPLIFGYVSNVNLLVSRERLRRYQFESWHGVKRDDGDFVKPEVVMEAIKCL